MNWESFWLKIEGGWHHIVVVKEKKKMSVYVDGERYFEGESSEFRPGK